MEWRPPEYALQNQLPFDQFWSYRDDTYSFGNGIEFPFLKCVSHLRTLKIELMGADFLRRIAGASDGMTAAKIRLEKSVAI